MGAAIMVVNTRFLVSLLQTGKEHHVLIKKGLPPDAKLRDVRTDFWKGEIIQLLFESKDFPETDLGNNVPIARCDIIMQDITPHQDT